MQKEGVSNCNVFDAPSFSFCEVWKFFKPLCFESFPQIFDFSHHYCPKKFSHRVN